MSDNLKPVRRWLSAVVLFILAMIVLGGITRLTQSGLSIVKWEPILGVKPPMNDAEWRDRFEAYKSATGQAAILFPDLTVEKFKGLFFWEYLHRLVGRATGLVFLAPYLYFLARRRLGRGLALKLAAAFLFGGLQGAVGWVMVASGLNPESAHVSHIKLAMHLGLALALLSYVLWLRLGIARERISWPGPRSVRRAAASLLLLVCVQIIYGAFTAGLRAGLLYNTFPKMNGLWIPVDAFALGNGWGDLINNPATVQFLHRALGWLVAVSVFALWLYAKPFPMTPRQRVILWLLPALTALQFALGVATLLCFVPVALGVAHQLCATLLLCAAVSFVHELRGNKTQVARVAPNARAG